MTPSTTAKRVVTNICRNALSSLIGSPNRRRQVQIRSRLLTVLMEGATKPSSNGAA